MRATRLAQKCTPAKAITPATTEFLLWLSLYDSESRDCALELRTNDVDGRLDVGQLRLRLVHRSRLEPAVRVHEHPLGWDQLERTADSLGDLLHRFDLMRMHVNDAEPDVLGERVHREVVQ